MKRRSSLYPDISTILARKTAGHRQQAALSFAERLAILDEMTERVVPIVQARELRKLRKSDLASKYASTFVSVQ
jgi:hypothetical protein